MANPESFPGTEKLSVIGEMESGAVKRHVNEPCAVATAERWGFMKHILHVCELISVIAYHDENTKRINT